MQEPEPDGSPVPIIKNLRAATRVIRMVASGFLTLGLLTFVFYSLLAFWGGTEVRLGVMLGPFALTWTSGMIACTLVETICAYNLTPTTEDHKRVWVYLPSIFFLMFIVIEAIAYGAMYLMWWKTTFFFTLIALALWFIWVGVAFKGPKKIGPPSSRLNTRIR